MVVQGRGWGWDKEQIKGQNDKAGDEQAGFYVWDHGVLHLEKASDKRTFNFE